MVNLYFNSIQKMGNRPVSGAPPVKLAMLILAVGMLISTAASSQVGAIIGIVGGSVAIDRAGNELRESIDHARAAASALIGKADAAAERRLNQIDGIIENTIGDLIGKSEKAALRILAKTTKDIQTLEKQIYSDVKKVIWDLECAGRRLAIMDIGTALGGLGDSLGTNQIRLTPANRVLESPAWYTGCFWWCKDPYIVDVMEPFGETYKQVRDLMEGAIAQDLISDDTPADQLVGTYEYLSSFALRTSCFYQGTEDRYNHEYINYKYKVRKWNNVLTVKL